MNQTSRIIITILTRVTTFREAAFLWAFVGMVILMFLYINRIE